MADISLESFAVSAAEESMAKMLADAGGEKSLSPNVQKALIV